uniref:Bestrophin homolog n=1 Tax=Ditylenchus dipsaci TaxID=166011 RepID=A0A915DIR3_9BILA
MIRYMCLTQVLVLRDISIKVRKRFPNMEAVVDAGFLQLHEKELMDSVTNGFTKYWMPINWVFAMAYDLRAKGKITADVLLNGLLVEVRTYRGCLQNLCNYDWVPVPLAYPKLSFWQYVYNYNAVDLYVPFMTQLQLVFYMGWLKVAEALLNPLGEDDDDFECNYIIDRNISIALSMVDDCYAEIPTQVRDKFEDGNKPLYSEVSSTMPIHALVGSACTVKTEEAKDRVKMVPHVDENGSIDNRSIGSGRHQAGGSTDGLYKRRFSARIKQSLTAWRLGRSMSLQPGMDNNLQAPHTSINLDSTPIPKDALSSQWKYPAPGTAENGSSVSLTEPNLKTPAVHVKSLPALLHLDTVSEEEETNNATNSTSTTNTSTTTSFNEPRKTS